MGLLYRLSGAKWRSFLIARASGKHVDIADYGTCIGGVDNVTDWTSDDATMELAA
jgi:hypothetical protein